MNKRKLCTSFILLNLIFLCSYSSTWATPGTPDSMQFGFGGWIDLHGQHINPSVNAAAGMGMDWIAVDFDWANSWSDPAVAPDLTVLNQVMSQAKTANLSVMLSITNPPTWALTPSGPEPNLSASLTLGLKQLYPETLMAVELFPEANTVKGWGTRPDPAAYGNLLSAACGLLQKNNIPLTLVAGGLKPLAPDASPEDMGDLIFLDSLYKSSPGSCSSVISIRLPDLTGDPMSLPAESEHQHLRHYEEVRQVMVQNNQSKSIIWITRFSWPLGGISSADSVYLKADEQAAWLNQSYRLMRAQLYIGTAFFSRINPSSHPAVSIPSSLILSDGSMHLAAQQMTGLISMSGSMKSLVFEGNISKKILEKLGIKPASP